MTKAVRLIVVDDESDLAHRAEKTEASTSALRESDARSSTTWRTPRQMKSVRGAGYIFIPGRL